MIIVTGMHRSGTSCISGLLEKCGYSLGTSHPIHQDQNPTNPKGHFENLQMLAINEALIKHSGGCWYKPPAQKNIWAVSPRIGPNITLFGENFNGDIAKDPRTCLTIGIWEKYGRNIDKIVFCLRNPLSVAKSLNTRDRIPMEYGLQLWYLYVYSFFSNAKKIPVVIVDYDNFLENYEFEMSSLLEALGSPLSRDEMIERTKGFYEKSLKRHSIDEMYLAAVPQHIKETYQAIKKRTFSEKQTNSQPA